MGPWTDWQDDPTAMKPNTPGAYGRMQRAAAARAAAEPEEIPTEPEPQTFPETLAMSTAETTLDRPLTADSVAGLTDNHDAAIHEIFRALAAPFPKDEVREREQWADAAHTRKVRFSYITPRTARRRLNEVLGPAGWDNRVTPYPNGVKCSITIRLPGGLSVTREALGGFPKMKSGDEDSFKGGDSDAFKRCAACFGVAEYLFGEPVYGDDDHSRHEPAPEREEPRRPRREDRDEDRRPAAGGGGGGRRREGSYGPPRESPAGREREERSGRGGGNGEARGGANGRNGRDRPPETAGQLLGWLRDGGDRLLGVIEKFGEEQGFPERIKNWNPQEVREAYGEALEILRGQD